MRVCIETKISIEARTYRMQCDLVSFFIFLSRVDPVLFNVHERASVGNGHAMLELSVQRAQ